MVHYRRAIADELAAAALRAILAIAISASVCGTSAGSATIPAKAAYYTFGPNVSANTERLLADKAPAIGFPDLPKISFLLFLTRVTCRPRHSGRSGSWRHCGWSATRMPSPAR